MNYVYIYTYVYVCFAITICYRYDTMYLPKEKKGCVRFESAFGCVRIIFTIHLPHMFAIYPYLYHIYGYVYVCIYI